MKSCFVRTVLFVSICTFAMVAFSPAQAPSTSRLESLKSAAINEIERMKEFTQQMVDQIFSFGELGFHEVQTSRYCVGVLKKNGFRVEEGTAGLPTGWAASWGSGKPVLGLISDIDCIPQASQKPGVAYHAPLVEGAPGHGEGHNSGVPLNITAAIAVKNLMERDHIPGTLRLWPGIAEELLGGKAYLVRAGCFKDVDLVLFCHVDSNMSTSYGTGSETGLVSVEYTFQGVSAHAGAAPWRGHSALDAVELMDTGWNYRREHLRLQHRSHYVITSGGDQPNVVPANASVWYFFRETDYTHIKELFDVGNAIAQAAAMMTDTKASWRLLGSAWPPHFNQPVAEALYQNIQKVGLPAWTEEDQALARAVQKEIAAPIIGLNTQLPKLGLPLKEEEKRGGGSDDIGDVSWNVPTVKLTYPCNIPGLPGHSWANAIAMATPMAHKGATAGAKVMAITMLDLLTRPDLVEKAWTYFRDVQTKEVHYIPFLGASDTPPTFLNKKTMERYQPDMERFYFDPARFKTYLDQLQIRYPTLRNP